MGLTALFFIFMSKSEKTIYEVGYHLLSTTPEDVVAKEVGNLKDKISSLGGGIISEEYPSQMNLSYEMTKEIDNKRVGFTSAYFGWIKFEMNPEEVADIKKMLDGNSNILRFIIVKTVRENTIYSPKIMKSTKRQSDDNTLSGPVEENTPINEEEVDKKIDEMVEEDASL